MRTLHKPTRFFMLLIALAALSLGALAGDNPTDPGISDQKAGSMLVFPYYTNKAGADTRIQITNVGAGAATNVASLHIILIDENCQQLDYYTCITPNGSLVDTAQAFDPTNKGYMIVLNVDPVTGAPDPARNWLIGNAFVKDGDYVGNYGAEAFWGTTEFISASAPAGDKTDVSTLSLKVPCEFAIEIQSPSTAVQRVIVAGLKGDISGTVLDVNDELLGLSGAAQVGTGLAFNAEEKGFSFQRFLTGKCISDALITATNPRVSTTLGTLIGTGAGHLRFSIGGGVGLILTSTKTPAGAAATWSGIRTLHKTKTTIVSLTVPVFMPAFAVGTCSNQ